MTEMVKGEWWLKFDINDWLTDPKLRKLSRENRDSWLTACLLMRLEGEYQMTGTPRELANALHLTSSEFRKFVADLKRTQVADVTLGNDFVTLLSRRYAREAKSKEQTKLRVRKLRGNADVTPEKRDRVISKKKEVRKEEEKREETPQAAPPSKPERRKGARLPDPFLLTASMREYGRTKRPDIDLTLETEKFCNYFRSAPGQKGVKLDWELTWRNWILGANGNGRSQANGYGNKRTDADVLAQSADFYANYDEQPVA